jgi:hypothetical protein
MGAPTTPTLVSLVADRVLTSDEARAAGRAALPLGDLVVLNCPSVDIPAPLRLYTRRNSTAKNANTPMRARTIATASSGVCFPSPVAPAITAKSRLQR